MIRLYRTLLRKSHWRERISDKRHLQVAAKNPGGLGDAKAKPRTPGVFKSGEAAEERSGWNRWH